MANAAAEIRALIERWAGAVRAGDLETVLADQAMRRIYEWPTTLAGDELGADYAAVSHFPEGGNGPQAWHAARCIPVLVRSGGATYL
jgi:hypothetical protein